MRKIIGVLVLFVLVNVVVVGFQIIPRLGSYWHLIQLEAQLKIDAAKISKSEDELRPATQHIEQLERQLDTLKLEIHSIEAEHSSGIPKKIYDEYSAKVSKYNLLVDEHKAAADSMRPKYADYKKQVELYNSLVSQRDSLKQEGDRIWFIVPRPGAFR